MKQNNSIILGVELASKAITFSFRHIKLFIYALIGLLLVLISYYIVIHLFTENIILFKFLSMPQEKNQPLLMVHLAIIIMPFISLATIKNVHGILTYEKRSFANYLRFSPSEILNVFLYIALYLALLFIHSVIAKFSRIPTFGLWQLFVNGLLFFMLVLIALRKKNNFLLYIRESLLLFFSHWLTIIGGSLWIGFAISFIVIIIGLPFIMLQIAGIYIGNENYYIFVFPAVMFLIETIKNSFKTMLYLRINHQLPSEFDVKARTFF